MGSVPLESCGARWVTLEPVAEKAPMSLTLFITKLSVWKVVTSTFKQCSKKNCFFFLTTTQTVDFSHRERSQLLLVRMVAVRQRWTLLSLRARWEVGEAQKWQGDLTVLSLGKGLGFAVCVFILYNRCHAFFPFYLYMY